MHQAIPLTFQVEELRRAQSTGLMSRLQFVMSHAQSFEQRADRAQTILRLNSHAFGLPLRCRFEALVRPVFAQSIHGSLSADHNGKLFHDL